MFCCFNNNYKITAPVFDVWMRLVQAVNGSVLGIHHHLHSPLAPGDEVLLLPQYQGG